MTDKADADVALEAEAVRSALEEARSSAQALTKAEWELNREQTKLDRQGSTLALADLETAEEVEAALKAAVGSSTLVLTPAEIRDIVQKKRDAILAEDQVADAEDAKLAAEASLAQAKAASAKQRSSTTAVVVVAVILVIFVVCGALYYVTAAQGIQHHQVGHLGGGSGGGQPEVVAFSNPMYDSMPAVSAPPAVQASSGYMDVSGGAAMEASYDNMGPAQGGAGYMDVSPGEASSGYQDVGGAAANEQFNEGFSSDDEDV